LLVLAAAASACGEDDASVDDTAGLDTSTDVYLQPGEPLFDQWVVPDETVVMGVAFPSPHGSMTVEALLTGDAHRAFDDIYDQAIAADLRPMGYPNEDGPCHETPLPNWSPEGVVDGAASYQCQMLGVDSSDAIVLEASVQVAAESEPSLAHAELRFTTPSPDSPRIVGDDLFTELSKPEGDAPISTPPLDSAGLNAGDPLRAVSWQGFDDAVVPDESRLLAPAGPAESLTGGYRFVVEILGDSEQALRQYEKLVGESCWLDDSQPETFTSEGVSVRYLYGGGAGSGDCQLITATTTDQRTFMLISWDND
jgi:hypothetical protein